MTTTRRPAFRRVPWGAVAFVVGCELVGIVGAATTSAGDSAWYRELAKPSFQPPPCTL